MSLFVERKEYANGEMLMRRDASAVSKTISFVTFYLFLQTRHFKKKKMLRMLFQLKILREILSMILSKTSDSR